MTDQALGLYRDTLAGTPPAYSVKEAVADLEDFIRVCPNQDQAPALAALLRQYLATTDQAAPP